MKMKKYVIFSALILTFLLTITSAGFSQSANSVPVISVNGTGSVILASDVAIIDIGVRTEGTDINQVLDENTAIVKKFKAALKELNVADEDVRSTAYSMYTSTNQVDQQTTMMYNVYYDFEVTLRDTELVSAVLDSAFENGMNQLTGVYFQPSQRSEALQAARDLAIADAQQQAAEIATKLGRELGGIKSFSVRDYPLENESSYAKSAPISAGDQTVSVTVIIEFEIK